MGRGGFHTSCYGTGRSAGTSGPRDCSSSQGCDRKLARWRTRLKGDAGRDRQSSTRLGFAFGGMHFVALDPWQHEVCGRSGHGRKTACRELDGARPTLVHRAIQGHFCSAEKECQSFEADGLGDRGFRQGQYDTGLDDLYWLAIVPLPIRESSLLLRCAVLSGTILSPERSPAG